MSCILLVEDNQVVGNMFLRRLKRKNHRVIWVRNGKDGVEKALELTPDAILMDMHMPIMDGHEAIRCLRHGHNYTGLIICVTASVATIQKQQAMVSGCNCVIAKPVTKDFENQIAELISNFAKENV